MSGLITLNTTLLLVRPLAVFVFILGFGCLFSLPISCIGETLADFATFPANVKSGLCCKSVFYSFICAVFILFLPSEFLGFPLVLLLLISLDWCPHHFHLYLIYSTNSVIIPLDVFSCNLHVVVFLLSFISKKFLISSVISFLTQKIYLEYTFSFPNTWEFPSYLLFLFCSLICSVAREHTQHDCSPLKCV